MFQRKLSKNYTKKQQKHSDHIKDRWMMWNENTSFVYKCVNIKVFVYLPIERLWMAIKPCIENKSKTCLKDGKKWLEDMKISSLNKYKKSREKTVQKIVWFFILHSFL